MYLRVFKQEHRILISQWLADRTMSDVGWGNLPRIGLVTYYESKPVAIGFIRTIEGGACFLDSFITDPNALPHVRDKCMKKLGYRLTNTAKRLKFTGIIVLSVCTNTIERTIQRGYTLLPHQVTSLKL